MTTLHVTDLVSVAALHPHPRNYREHPEDQRAHLAASIREHGFYRNVVVADDDTILAGHGVVEAATDLGLERVPVVRMAFGPDDPRALKILAGDNEIARLAGIDDRALSELLRDIRDVDIEALLGTGYDDAMLANLVFVTRPASEIGDRDDAAAWAGMPTYGEPTDRLKIVVAFDTDDDRRAFLELIGVDVIHHNERGVWSIRWPAREMEDQAALRFTDNGDHG